MYRIIKITNGKESCLQVTKNHLSNREKSRVRITLQDLNTLATSVVNLDTLYKIRKQVMGVYGNLTAIVTSDITLKLLPLFEQDFEVKKYIARDYTHLRELFEGEWGSCFRHVTVNGIHLNYFSPVYAVVNNKLVSEFGYATTIYDLIYKAIRFNIPVVQYDNNILVLYTKTDVQGKYYYKYIFRIKDISVFKQTISKMLMFNYDKIIK